MLTSGQCVIAAYLTDGDVICVDCANKVLPDAETLIEERTNEAASELGEGESLSWSERREIREAVEQEVREAEENEGLRPLIQYELDSDETWNEEGLYCGDCGKELVEPYEDPDLGDDDGERVKLYEEGEDGEGA